jgi:hypothetical protein
LASSSANLAAGLGIGGTMQIISFRNTRLFKRGIFLSAAALIAFIMAPAAANGSLWENPVPNWGAACILIGFLGYFLRKTPIHRLADEVADCEDHLRVWRGGAEEMIPFANISKAEVASTGGLHWITVVLTQPLKFGGQIEFLPQASLWSNLPAVKRVAAALTERAIQARGAPPPGKRLGQGD